MLKFIIVLILCVLTILAGIFMLGLNVAWYNFSALGIGLIIFGAILFIVIGIISVFYAVEHGKL